MTIDLVPLTPQERQRLRELEAEIESGLKTFIHVGTALTAIRDERLYKQEFRRFDEYCRRRWGHSRIQAHRLIESAAVTTNLLPMGNRNSLPTSERQVRPLTRLPTAEAQREAWKSATEAAAAEGKLVTARHVEAAVKQVSGESQPPAPAVPPRTKEKYSNVLQELKYFYRLATPHIRKVFREWIADREASKRFKRPKVHPYGSEFYGRPRQSEEEQQ